MPSRVIGLSGVAVSGLGGECVCDLQTGLDRVVAVDDGDGALIAACQLGRNGVCLDRGDVVAAVVDDVEVADALLSACILGESDEAFLLEEEKCAGLVGVVCGDDDGSAVCEVSKRGHAVAVDAERLVVDKSCGDEVGSVGLVVALEVGGVKSLRM